MAFDASGAEGGAAQGSAAGPWGALIGGLLGGFFNKAPQTDPRMRDLYNGQIKIADQLGDFAGSVPMSSPEELAALSQQRGLMGEEQRQGQARLFSAIGSNQGMGNLGDLLANLTNNQIGQRTALTGQMLMQALQARRQALLQRSNVLQAAFNPAAAPKQGGVDVSGPLSQAAYAYFQNQGAGGAGGGGSNPNVLGNPSGSPFGGGIPQAQSAGATVPVVNAPTAATDATGQGGAGGMNFQNLIPSMRTPQLTLPSILQRTPGNPISPFNSNPWLG